MKEGLYMNKCLGEFSKDKWSGNDGEAHKGGRWFICGWVIVGGNLYMGIGRGGGKKIGRIVNEVIVDYLKSDGWLEECINKARFYNEGGRIF